MGLGGHLTFSLIASQLFLLFTKISYFFIFFVEFSEYFTWYWSWNGTNVGLDQEIFKLPVSMISICKLMVDQASLKKKKRTLFKLSYFHDNHKTKSKWIFSIFYSLRSPYPKANYRTKIFYYYNLCNLMYFQFLLPTW